MTKSEKKGPIVEQIAKRLGISRSATYFALAGSSKVSEATRQRVYQLADSLGYQPNLLAKSLSSKKTGIIGVIMPELFGGINTSMVHELDNLGMRNGYKFMYACSFGDAKRERELLNWYMGSHIEGLMLWPVDESPNINLYSSIAEQIPVIFLERPVKGIATDLFAIDNFQIGYQAGQYLIKHGCSRIAYYSPEADVKEEWVAIRLRGLTQALEDYQLPVPAVITVPGFDYHPPTIKDTMGAYLRQGTPFNGLFAANDMMAHGAILAMLEAGINIPDDVAVIGCDNTPFGEMLSPQLTTMSMPMAMIGKAAFDRITYRLENPTDNGPFQQVFIPAQILPRASCGE